MSRLLSVLLLTVILIYGQSLVLALDMDAATQEAIELGYKLSDTIDKLQEKANSSCNNCKDIVINIANEGMDLANALAKRMETIPLGSGDYARLMAEHIDWHNRGTKGIIKKYDAISTRAPEKSLCGQCGDVADARLAALIAEFGDANKAEVVLKAYEQAVLALSLAQQALKNALISAEYKKVVDAIFRRFYDIKDNISVELYEHYLDRIQRTLFDLKAREQILDLNIKNPYTSPYETVQKHAQGGGFAFISTDDPEQRIFLKNMFFQSSDIRGQTACVIHEQSHASVNTRDIGSYGYWENRLLKTPQEAFSNADSFAYFVWDVSIIMPK